jgi:hypothetical protein
MNIANFVQRIDQARNNNRSAGQQISDTRNTNQEMDYTRSDQVIKYMHGEMVNNGRRMLATTDPTIFPYDWHIPKLIDFYLKVKEGGPWDHKPQLRGIRQEEELEELGYEPPIEDKNDPEILPGETAGIDANGNPIPRLDAERLSFPIRGDTEHEYFFDIWSNIHYGYVGRAGGFSEFLLIEAAERAGGGYSPSDELSIRIGMELWQEHGTSLTEEDLRQAILDHTDEYLEIQSQDTDQKDVDVVREPWNRR